MDTNKTKPKTKKEQKTTTATHRYKKKPRSWILVIHSELFRIP